MYHRHILATALFTLTLPLASHANTYPNGPVRIIVPYTPGGSSDIAARLVASKLGEQLGQPVIVDNRPGASGVIGSANVARAPADGQTLLFTVTSLIQSAALPEKPPYDAFVDFTPVSEVARTNFIFIANADVAADTLAAFLSDAQARPNAYSNGSYGSGTSSHLYGEVLKQAANIRMVHVPYKGGAPMFNDLLAGQVPVAFSDIGSARAHLGTDRIKVYAVTGTERFAILPDIPTFGEQGVPGLDLDGWYGLFAPAGTDPAIVEQLSQAVAGIVQQPDVKARFHELGLQPVGSTPAAFAANLARDEPKWRAIIESAVKED